MRPHLSNQRNHALTRTDVIVTVLAIVALFFLFPVIYTVIDLVHQGPMKINCVSNLREIDLSYLVWAGDNGEKYPAEVSVTNGGAMELVATGNVAACFQSMSNELTTPKLLICPEDTHRVWATNFSTGFNNSHISYFVGLDADQTNPQMLLSGDDNFAVGGVPVKSGLLQLSTSSPIAWTSGRHVSYNSHFWTPARYRFVGNIGLADGSVQQLTMDGLQQALQRTGVATNRLAIP
jgi:hypothetical protein